MRPEGFEKFQEYVKTHFNSNKECIQKTISRSKRIKTTYYSIL